MKVLLVNKFLFPKGGSETYVFKLGETLERHGHSVEYFGLKNDKNIVGNSADSFVSDLDFNKGILRNLTAPFRMIYSCEARRKIKKVLYKFNPDVVHLNNIQFHLTPSIILEIQKYRKNTGKDLKIIYTAHDYQLICPSHGFFDNNLNNCEKCIGGKYWNCIQSKCMKNSRLKSIIAAFDAFFWSKNKAYSYVDAIICPSLFMKSKLDSEERFASKTIAIHNFLETHESLSFQKGSYVLEFGHLSRDKGTNTLLEAAKRMPGVKFVFAGYGEAVEDIKKIENAEYVGFKTGEELRKLISGAACSVCPSEMYENCPYTVIESQIYGTPVVGARIGGIPELINEGKSGLLFEPGNADELLNKLKSLFEDDGSLDKFTENCKDVSFETPDSYYEKLISVYGGKQ